MPPQLLVALLPEPELSRLMMGYARMMMIDVLEKNLLKFYLKETYKY